MWSRDRGTGKVWSRDRGTRKAWLRDRGSVTRGPVTMVLVTTSLHTPKDKDQMYSEDPEQIKQWFELFSE